MNGSAPNPASKHEWRTTAPEHSAFIPHESGVLLLERAVANRPTNEDLLRGIA